MEDHIIMVLDPLPTLSPGIIKHQWCKVKVCPLQAMKAHEGWGYKGPHILSHSLGRGKLASPTLDHLYHQVILGTEK